MIRKPIALLGTVLALAACGSHGGGGVNAGTYGTSATGHSSANVIAHPTAVQQHTLDKLNDYRSQNGAGPLVLDADLTSFATEGNQQLSAGGGWHAHFQSAGDSIFEKGFCGQAAENQGMWQGGDEAALIDDILQGMMDEGPGGGHHDNIINPQLSRVGVGLAMVGGALWLTNDFSGNCN